MKNNNTSKCSNNKHNKYLKVLKKNNKFKNNKKINKEGINIENNSNNQQLIFNENKNELKFSCENDIDTIEQLFKDDINSNYNNLLEYIKQKNKKKQDEITTIGEDITSTINYLYKIITNNIDISIDNNTSENIQLEDIDKKKFYLKRIKKLLLNDKRLLNIIKVDCICPNIEELYLQRNVLKDIEFCTNMNNLIVLSAHSNFIKNIPNLNSLNSLVLINISDNLIEHLIYENLPKSIEIFYFYDNIYFNDISIIEYRYNTIKFLKNIKILDKLKVDYNELILYNSCESYEAVNKLLVKNINKNKSLEYVTNHYNNIDNSVQNYLKNNENTNSNLNTNISENVNSTKTIIYNNKLDILNDNEYLLYIKEKEKLKQIFKERLTNRVNDYKNNKQKRSIILKNKLNKIKDLLNSKINNMFSTERYQEINERFKKVIEHDKNMSIIEKALENIKSRKNSIQSIKEVDEDNSSEISNNSYNTYSKKVNNNNLNKLYQSQTDIYSCNNKLVANKYTKQKLKPLDYVSNKLLIENNEKNIIDDSIDNYINNNYDFSKLQSEDKLIRDEVISLIENFDKSKISNNNTNNNISIINNNNSSLLPKLKEPLNRIINKQISTNNSLLSDLESDII